MFEQRVEEEKSPAHKRIDMGQHTEQTLPKGAYSDFRASTVVLVVDRYLDPALANAISRPIFAYLSLSDAIWSLTRQGHHISREDGNFNRTSRSDRAHSRSSRHVLAVPATAKQALARALCNGS